ncbi:MAG TPA: DUF4189 domain-containing protein [Stellaceae bacterium]|jgi:hypothetical protein|nr:DUF4189 domain-containing protein [Stellaceae bacterium]
MRRTSIIAAVIAALLTTGAASPALAGFGALAHDDATGKYGLSSDKATQTQADETAMKDCVESSCKIIFRTKARQCGAIATAEQGKAWGASDKGNQKDTVELRALKACQERTGGQCKVRASGCNR